MNRLKEIEARLAQHYERTEETAVLGIAYIGNSYLANTF